MTRRHVIYLIVADDPRVLHPHYFSHHGILNAWEWTAFRADAKQFTSRALAVKTMQAAGKHREGWRVIHDLPAPLIQSDADSID